VNLSACRIREGLPTSGELALLEPNVIALLEEN
jgi:hypothetical protein